MAVLDSDFRVRGTEGLRVVDASVFPHIPGFFIVAPIYMIGEKASRRDPGRRQDAAESSGRILRILNSTAQLLRRRKARE